jgi:SAM-dependent methyltransferase
MEIFGGNYASLYDLFYESKDNSDECDRILRQLDIAGPNAAGKAILDLGCGAGRHAIELANRGCRVTGVDRSEAMIERARQKAAGFDGSDAPEFLVDDIRDLKLDRTFDAAIMMFAVFGYQTSNADAIATLEGIRRRLPVGGRLVFDVWHGPGVLNQKPESRIQRFSSPSGEILRIATPELDLAKQICRVEYEVWTIAPDAPARRDAETHDMRFFFPREIELLLAASGFDLVSLTPFPNTDDRLDENVWNVFVTASAR